MARKKSFDRTVVKKCPFCGQQCPVARKACSCGHQFPTRTRAQPVRTESQDSTEGEGRQRRAVRTKRMRPDFFNPSDDDYITKKKNSESDAPKKKRGRPRRTSTKPKTDAEKAKEKEAQKPVEEDMYANLPPEKSLQYSFVLAELNRKMCGQNFRPV